MIEIKIGDCTNRLKEIEDNSVDAIICDPPYGLKFMSKGWGTALKPAWEPVCIGVKK